jgi:predicted transcriptional regulator of viral defense system
LGCLPPDQFIPDLMESLKLRYYVSLLSAAQYHGAAHQRPQVFQVFLEDKRRPIVCGRVHVTFMVRKKLRDVAVQKLNTPRGFLLVSTPEATALDLVGYAHQSGGLNNVATVLSELAEKIDGEQLAKAAAAAPIVWAQRLGYLLEQVGSAGKAAALKAHVRARARKATPLKPGAPHEKAKQDRAWKLSINTDVETDL